MFQSTHPRGVRHSKTARRSRNCRFQSTHPRGVRRHVCGLRWDPAPVSIHAPAWGATPTARPRRPIQRKFQSTHPRGVRRAPVRKHGLPSRCFNPRTRVGCDAHEFEQPAHPHVVSIHAPAWGATCGKPHLTRRTPCFNPRTRVGCDTPLSPLNVTANMFQSTHPRGVRLVSAIILQANMVFQSTHPRGVRHRRRIWTCRLILVSIHAPAWGATSRACPDQRP